jgi:two-component system phosphate regulon sensor histidine kinase PhoR
MSFRRKLFLAAFAAAFVTVAVATGLVSWSLRRDLLARLERGLVSEARLASELMTHHAAAHQAAIDAEADALGRSINARVTLIAADGRVLGDSERDGEALERLENHGGRPEVIAALRAGVGTSTRYSTTIDTDMMYVAVPVRDSLTGVAVVRLALPLTEVRDQLDTIGRLALLALGAGLAVSLALAWGMSTLVSRRVSAIAAVAERYRRGDVSRTPADYGTDEIGTVARVLDQSVQDLTRRLAEIARDRALMSAILDGMSEGVIVVDGRGQLQLVNGAARTMLSFTTPEQGKHYLEAVRHPAIAAQLDAALAGGIPEPSEVPIAASDRVYVARTAPVATPEGPIAVVVLHDITDLKRADRVRRDFVANVSHELRTPLTAVRGYVETLLEDPGDRDQTRKFLEIVDRHSARMERLVRDLLHLARIEGGQERLERVRLPLAGVFGDVQAALAPFLGERRQHLSVDIARDAETVEADPAKIHDVVRNLVENATNYSPEGTTIRVRSRRSDGQVLIDVEDEGPGIPESDLTRIFERFYRVDKARARGVREAGGTGLGLAIVKHLVGLHGGTVTARNGARGAVFTVSLPDAPSSRPNPRAEPTG